MSRCFSLARPDLILNLIVTWNYSQIFFFFKKESFFFFKEKILEALAHRILIPKLKSYTFMIYSAHVWEWDCQKLKSPKGNLTQVLYLKNFKVRIYRTIVFI